MKIISNFLETSKFKELQRFVFSSELPFYYNDKIVGDEQDNKKNDFMFTHGLYDVNKQQSDYFNFITMPLLGKLNLNYLIRAKLNCYTKKNEFIHSGMHIDFKTTHKVALFSFNTCNGYTYFKDTKEQIKSIENQMIIFNGNREHCSVSQTDTNLRINININFN
tara:strand:+ start:1185 stop:1676 length:492 start_codon:yes stop_codon:yes gene_type:complete